MASDSDALALPGRTPGWLDKERSIAAPGYNRWLVPPAALAIHLCIGMAYGFCVFWLPLSRSVGTTCTADMGTLALLFATACDWPVSALSFTFTLFIVLLGIAAALWGGWLEHAGPRKAGAIAALCWCGGRAIGALGVYTLTPRTFSDWDTRLLTSLANHAAIALQQAEALEQLKAAQERQAVAETFAVLGDIAANLLHRVNNLIGVIPVRVQGVLDKRPALQADAYVDHALHEIEDSARATMAAARESMGYLRPLRLAPTSIETCYRTACSRLNVPPNIELTSTGLESLPPVIAGEEQLRLVLFNLIENAIDALGTSDALGDRGGHITVSGRMIADPINLLDCSPVCDGSAAIVMCPSEIAAQFSPFPIKVRASAIATDSLALHDRHNLLSLEAVGLSARKAFEQAQVKREDIDLFEVHDAFSITAVVSLEACGFAEPGKGTRLGLDGDIFLGGKLPICTMGGLKARGHPVGATGMYQLVEATLQLRGLAGKNQVKDAALAMTQNIGGSGSNVVTHILEREA